MPEIKTVKKIKKHQIVKLKKNKMSPHLKPLFGAIDLGGTKIASALFSQTGRPLFRCRVPVALDGDLTVLDKVISLYYQFEAEAGKKA